MALTWRAAVLMAAGVIPALLWPSAGTVVAWALLVVVVCGVDIALAASPRRVEVQRFVPQSVRLGELATSELVVRNVAGRRLRGVVRDAWPPSAGAGEGSAAGGPGRHTVDLPHEEAIRLTTPLRPMRRGDRLAGGVTVRTLGPLGIAGRQHTLPVPGRLRVLPEFASRKHLPSRMARLRELDGRAAVQVRGEGTEFDSLREYVVGDDVRSIDWRATARRGDVVVRTWRPERDRRVLIVLDTGRTSAARVGAVGSQIGAPRVDASIEAALLLSALAGRAGDRVELVAYDRAVRARVQGAAGPRLMPAMAEALSVVGPVLLETDWPGVVGQVRERMSQRALVVLLTSLDPAAVENGLLAVVDQLTRDHQVVVASVADEEVAGMAVGRGSSSEVYDAAAAARGGLERTAATTMLRRYGAEVIEALPDDLAPRLADTYLALKAAGRL
ncbi:DUF58 domain-containing protein [Myceligenerans pegani]|uniref:DUF58 domain-containing protein n=1 Tax=Myceligenerans pegani TaxID=2776917 RepID=A0ABR9MY85_9MICO|nr:DUF58 domain-containing protein [Myceligenerans sp. TRM 65318]MBE1876348.1 DUF58 domain-containing protein [Myceligenerans sp. TRM 65318]MBE3018619.1 DUF58 domain-containing protein [Myceligenerans sp. TRM 65318]